jgi:1-acyl-sn-glycerol-3-phosphate acyltransferase
MTPTVRPIEPRPRLARLRIVLKLGAIVLASIVLVPLQWVVRAVASGPAAFVLPRLWFTVMRRALGIRVDIVGVPRRGGGTVFVGNHVSHYDIVLLGSLLGARFIAKDDMERWPGMRFIGRLGQTLFISRRRQDAASVAASLAADIRAHHDIVLFAEGTTSSGEQVAPFKSSLFSLFLAQHAAGQPWVFQPFTLDLRSVDGRSLEEGGERDIYAFHGSMAAGAHVKRFLGLAGARVRVVFHAPVAIGPATDRKQLASRLHDTVAAGLPAAAHVDRVASTGDTRAARSAGPSTAS